MKLARRTLCAAALLLPAAAAAQTPAPAAPIAALNAALLAAMRAGTATPFATRVAALRPAVEGAFDLPTILRNSVGPRWASFSPAQQADLLAAFTDFTVATWVNNFDSESGQRFTVAPQTRTLGQDQVVETSIISRTGDTNRIDYQMRQTPSGWRAVDVLLDGTISRVAVQRSDFRAVLAQGGADALIASLRQRTSALSSGGA